MTRSTIHDESNDPQDECGDSFTLKGTRIFESSESLDPMFRPDFADDRIWRFLWQDNSLAELDRGVACADDRPHPNPVFDEKFRHRYLVGKHIASGGMGNVYEGWDVRLQRQVAIKIIRQELADNPHCLLRFIREARIASGLNHPGIVPIYEFSLTNEKQAFIVMGMLQGTTLANVLNCVEDRASEIPGLLSYFFRAAQAIAFAHSRGVIHRDITPSNIMVGQFGVACVLDWGLAKLLDRPVENFDCVASNIVNEDLFEVGSEDFTDFDTCGTQHGSVLGTPSHLAPEQARGENDRVDKRTDVFGLGGILCDILTGEPPFSGDDPLEIYAKSAAGDLSEAFDRLESCQGPRFIVSLARRCLSPNQADRPADAGEVVKEMIEYREAGQRRAEQDLVRFFELTLDLLCIANLDGYFCRVNQNFTKTLGYSEKELTSKRFLEFVHPDDQEATIEEIRRLARGEPTIRFINRYRHVDGHYLWLEWSARSVPIEAAVYAVARDVTDRIHAAASNKSRYGG